MSSPFWSLPRHTWMNKFSMETLSNGKMVYVIDIVSFAIYYHESQMKFCNGIILYGCTNNNNYASYLQLSSCPFLLSRQLFLYGNPPTENPIFPKGFCSAGNTSLSLAYSSMAHNLLHFRLHDRGSFWEISILNNIKKLSLNAFSGSFYKASIPNYPKAHFSHALHYILIMLHRKAFKWYCLARHPKCLFHTHREIIKGITSTEKFTVMFIKGSDKRLNACTNVSLKQ